MQTRNKFPLSPKDGVRESPKLQYVIWAPNPSNKTVSSINTDTGNRFNSQAIAFVYENDLYYKPKVQNDLVCRITATGMCMHTSFCSMRAAVLIYVCLRVRICVRVHVANYAFMIIEMGGSGENLRHIRRVACTIIKSRWYKFAEFLIEQI